MADFDGGSGGNPFLIYDVNTLWQIAHGDDPERLSKRADELEDEGNELIDRAKQLRDTIKLLDGHYHSPEAAPAMFQAIRDRATAMHDVGSALLGAATLTRSAGEVLADTQRAAKQLMENRQRVVIKLPSDESDVNEYVRHRLADMVSKLNHRLYEFSTGYPSLAVLDPRGGLYDVDGPTDGSPTGHRYVYADGPASTHTVPPPPGGWLPPSHSPSDRGAPQSRSSGPQGTAATETGRQATNSGRFLGMIGAPRGESGSTAPLGRTLGGKSFTAPVGRVSNVDGTNRTASTAGAGGTGATGTTRSAALGAPRATPPGGPGSGHPVPPGTPGIPGSGGNGGRDRTQRRTWYEKIEDEFKALEANPPGGEISGLVADTTPTPGPGVLGDQKAARDEGAASPWERPKETAAAPEGFPDDLKSFTRKDGIKFEVRRPSRGA